MRYLIINADDYGMTKSCTKAIAEAFLKSKISSTTICTNGDYFSEAVEIAYKMEFDKRIGIHINLTQGTPLSDKIKLSRFFCDKEGNFHGKFNRNRILDNEQKILVRDEIAAQIGVLKNAGVCPTHCDSHHHVHTFPNLSKIFIDAILESGINKIRIGRNLGKIKFLKRFVKKLYNKYVFQNKFYTTDYFGSIYDYNEEEVKDNAIIELMVHPDYSEHQELIDRTGYDNNGIPVGNKLIFENIRDCIMCNYSYLPVQYS